MKQIKPFLIMIGITTLLAEIVAIVLLLIGADKMATLGIAEAKTPADSLNVLRDSLGFAYRDSSGNAVKGDSAAVALVQPQEQKIDSVPILKALWEEEKKKNLQLEKNLVKQQFSADSAKAKDRKNMAQLLEAMKADEAARILENLDDTEAKKVLVFIKKKQAGKILSALEPERALKIMR